MEFPDDILALIREFSRPRYTKEALREYKRTMGLFWMWPLKEIMTTQEVVDLVRRYNDTSDAIDAICSAPGPTWRTDLTKCYQDREFLGTAIKKRMYR